MAENAKKNNRPRRPQDQAQGAAGEAPRIGKIAGPRRPQQENGKKRWQGGRGRQNQAQPKQEQPRKPAQPKSGDRGKGKRPAIGSAPIAAAQQQAARAAQPPQPASRRNTRGRGRRSRGPAIRAYFLGGLNEIGKNFTLYECQEDMFIVDCGLSFPDEDMLGIDMVIPDFTFVEKNRSKIRGVIITHGHEDHIGAVPRSEEHTSELQSQR